MWLNSHSLFIWEEKGMVTTFAEYYYFVFILKRWKIRSSWLERRYLCKKVNLTKDFQSYDVLEACDSFRFFCLTLFLPHIRCQVSFAVYSLTPIPLVVIRLDLDKARLNISQLLISWNCGVCIVWSIFASKFYTWCVQGVLHRLRPCLHVEAPPLMPPNGRRRLPTRPLLLETP